MPPLQCTGDIWSCMPSGLWNRVGVPMPLVPVPRGAPLGRVQLSAVPPGPPHSARWPIGLPQRRETPDRRRRTNRQILRELLREWVLAVSPIEFGIYLSAFISRFYFQPNGCLRWVSFRFSFWVLFIPQRWQVLKLIKLQSFDQNWHYSDQPFIRSKNLHYSDQPFRRSKNYKSSIPTIFQGSKLLALYRPNWVY